jgi:hypothetical protein
MPDGAVNIIALATTEGALKVQWHPLSDVVEFLSIQLLVTLGKRIAFPVPTPRRVGGKRTIVVFGYVRSGNQLTAMRLENGLGYFITASADRLNYYGGDKMDRIRLDFTISAAKIGINRRSAGKPPRQPR